MSDVFPREAKCMSQAADRQTDKTERPTEKERRRNFSFDGIGMVHTANSSTGYLTINLSAADYTQSTDFGTRIGTVDSTGPRIKLFTSRKSNIVRDMTPSSLV